MRDFERIDTELLGEAIRSKRFLAASRAHMSIDEIATWDRSLVRELRLLVPIDLQALHVSADGGEEMVRVPLLLAGPDGVEPDQAMPELFAPGEQRQRGVHLHWAMPDALLRGQLAERADGSANRLGLPPLPDRWVVLRIVLEMGADRPHVRGWVLEADRAVAVPLESWSPGSDASTQAVPTGVVLAPDELTGTVGGSAVWACVYDAVGNRFAFHDPLDDLDEAAGRGVDNDSVAYMVAGWWHDPGHDPIDSARDAESLSELFERLRWRLLPDWGDARFLQEYNESLQTQRSPLGLTVDGRFAHSSRNPRSSTAPNAAAGSTFVPMDKVLTTENKMVASSAFAADAITHFVTTPWHLRSCLLHGAVYGVPVQTAPAVDRRPATDAVRVALGEHDGDVLAALATVADTPEERRRDTERLLEAFAAQKINRLGSPDGTVEIEELEHSRAFASLPAGSAGTDRFVQRAEPGRAGGSVIGSAADIRATTTGAARSAAPGGAFAQPQRAATGADVLFSVSKYELTAMSVTQLLDYQWDRRPITLPATEARVVDRPAVRHTFPSDPMVAVQGAGRSLRHANDGRSSADGKLTCRWPTQVVSADQGIIAGDELIGTLGNGAIPPEVLSLAREVALHDPYHTGWLAAAAAPKLGIGSDIGIRLVQQRLLAESAFRFGTDATYDGTTSVFTNLASGGPSRRAGSPRRAAATPITSTVQASLVADRMHSFSIVKGADPDPVGVTCWSQPWVPLWLEWQVECTGPTSPSVDGWELGTVDLEPAGEDSSATPAMTMRTVDGRALLTAGAATTLRHAVSDWLKAENARDDADPMSGQADEQTEQALAALGDAVTRVDVVTAALDGLRTQLLGLPYADGLRRSNNGSGVIDPAPVEAPQFFLAGSLRITRARLLDAFGRVLELPLDNVSVTVRDSVDGDPGALSVPPRLMRPARWQFRLVDAATSTGVDGIEARIDEVDPTLQVNPVAGFLLPDHLDESLEVFDVAGNPLGELLHEPVGGGVVWEIAPGREGPPDAGPRHGLTESQQVLGSFATGLVAADAGHRGGRPADDESALSALLRAVDTTMWTVDTFASLGSEHVAGLVGRPIAVVRAQLRLELRPPDDIDLSDPARQAEWEQAEQELAAVAFPVRIGELTRTDDGVLGFFVGDDFSRFRPVDKVVADLAVEAGRSRGQLGLLQPGEAMPNAATIDHPYVIGERAIDDSSPTAGRAIASEPDGDGVRGRSPRDDGEPGSAFGDSDTMHLHVGQTVTLTLLMFPAGKVHLSSGILPRMALALARGSVAPGLGRIAPALRTGPVLVETDLAADGQVRLPKVSVFGTDQDFWWRDTPGSWRNDAILAATQTALLPDTPAEFRDGWIRVRPTAPDDAGTTTP